MFNILLSWSEWMLGLFVNNMFKHSTVTWFYVKWNSIHFKIKLRKNIRLQLFTVHAWEDPTHDTFKSITDMEGRVSAARQATKTAQERQTQSSSVLLIWELYMKSSEHGGSLFIAMSPLSPEEAWFIGNVTVRSFAGQQKPISQHNKIWK